MTDAPIIVVVSAVDGIGSGVAGDGVIPAVSVEGVDSIAAAN